MYSRDYLKLLATGSKCKPVSEPVILQLMLDLQFFGLSYRQVHGLLISLLSIQISVHLFAAFA